MLTYDELLQMKRWNTPTIYNGWEQVTAKDITGHFNKEEVHDFMPEMGPMVGYAVTMVFEPSKKYHTESKNAWTEYRSILHLLKVPKLSLCRI